MGYYILAPIISGDLNCGIPLTERTGRISCQMVLAANLNGVSGVWQWQIKDFLLAPLQAFLHLFIPESPEALKFSQAKRLIP